MTRIDLTVMHDRLERTLQRVRDRKIIIPTFAQQRDPSLVPADIQNRLKEIGLWDLHALNLFRITRQPNAAPTLWTPVGNHFPTRATILASVPVKLEGNSR